MTNRIARPQGLPLTRQAIVSSSLGSSIAIAPPATASLTTVRRLCLNLETAINGSLHWTVFERNGPALWASIRASANAILNRLFTQGTFQGSTPATAYFVKCDATTMTQADVDNGTVNLLVGFAPVTPAEFVVIQIGLMAAKA